MRKLFADSDYLIALLHPKEVLHSRARALAKENGDALIVTSEMVLTEFLNVLGKRGEKFRSLAARIIDELRSRGDVQIEPQTSQRFRSALKKYREYLDKKWSLTDCSSFLIMDSLQITEALSNDRHFEQAGYRALLRKQ